jgi:hypothetical protein
MFRRVMRSNWLFLIIAAVLLGTFDRGLFLGFSFFSLPVPLLSFDIGLIASYCGVLSFGVQCTVWIANIVRWMGRRKFKSA